MAEAVGRRWSGRGGHAWRLAVAEVKRTSTVCAWCGQPLHRGLRYRDPVTGQVNLLSTSVDHATPRALGGHPTDRRNLVAMHLGCNLSKGAKPLSARPEELNTDRDW